MDINTALTTYFQHSNIATAALRRAQQDVVPIITTGLISVAPTRFSTFYLATRSIINNLPAIQLAYTRNDFQFTRRTEMVVTPRYSPHSPDNC